MLPRHEWFPIFGLRCQDFLEVRQHVLCFVVVWTFLVCVGGFGLLVDPQRARPGLCWWGVAAFFAWGGEEHPVTGQLAQVPGARRPLDLLLLEWFEKLVAPLKGQ